MKNIFTFGIFLLLLTVIGSNVNAATITAAVPLTDSNWATAANWVGGVVPTYADDVVIPAGDSISSPVSTTYCNSITVSGTFYNSSTFFVNGNITVNAGGVFNIHSTLYCYNLINSGKFWNPSQAYGGSPKNLILGAGFSYNGTTYTTVYGTSDYIIQNDGIIGASRAKALGSSGNGGPGIYIYYSNIAKSVTIQPSSPSVTGTIFTVGALAPFNSTTAATQDFTLNIKQSIALLRYSTVFCFSLQNGDVSTGFKRTCNIFANDTVFINGNLHARGSAPSANQGNMIYNIDGCLDLASLAITNSVNSLDLYTSATSPSIAINVNNGGSLILGKAVKLIASAASGQSISINPATGSTVKFGMPTGLVVATPITLTNVSLPISLDNTTIANTYGVSLSLTGAAAQTIVGGSTSVTALTINNTSAAGVALSSSLNVTGALTLTTATAGKLSLGNNNLTVGSIAGATSSSYVVTDGTGKLIVPAAASTATLIPVGASATSYDPVTVTATTGTNFAVRTYTTLTGLPVYGVRYNPKEWDISPAAASSTLIALTPSSIVESVLSPVIGHYNGSSYDNISATMINSNLTFSGTFSTFSPFVTGANIDVTAVENVNANLFIYPATNSVVVRNAKVGDLVTVYGVNGYKVTSTVVKGDNTNISVRPGIYIVKTASTGQKVSVL